MVVVDGPKGNSRPYFLLQLLACAQVVANDCLREIRKGSSMNYDGPSGATRAGRSHSQSADAKVVRSYASPMSSDRELRSEAAWENEGGSLKTCAVEGDLEHLATRPLWRDLKARTPSANLLASSRHYFRNLAMPIVAIMRAIIPKNPDERVPKVALTAHSPALGVTFVLSALALATPAYAQEMPGETDGQIEQLQAGEFFWVPEIAPDGPVTIIISLATQRAYVYRNEIPIGVSTVSTGAEGHETPTGIFTILQKDIDHVSNLYADAPMPFMQRLTWDGIAMHEGNLPGYPASHGCIRLPRAFAEELYEITALGMTVIITNEEAVPIVSSAATILDDDSGADLDAGYRWEPELSPSGPVSVVVHGRDRRVIVMRNGVEIGSSPILIDGVIERTSAFTLQSVDADGEHWLRLPLPGAMATGELSQADQGKGRLPDGFREALATVLVPGVTLLVTRETLKSSIPGHPLSILTSGEE